MVRSIAALLIAALLAGCNATTGSGVAQRSAIKPTTHAMMTGIAY
jgi:predicted small secreted protein